MLIGINDMTASCFLRTLLCLTEDLKTFTSNGVTLYESSVTLAKCNLDNSDLLLDAIKREVPVSPFMFTIEKYRNKKQHLWPGHTLANDQVTRLVGNLCVFKCDVCLTIFPSWVRLETHLSSRHGRPIFKNFDVHNIVEARYHRCCICTHILLCDKSIIKRHIRKHRHNGVDITYEAYKELAQKTENAGPNLSEEDRVMMHPSIPQYKALVLRKKRELNVKDSNRAYKMELFWSMFPDDNGDK